jgi:hypothetical protein
MITEAFAAHSRFCDPAVIPVVARYQWDGASRLPRQRARVVGVKIPARKRGGKIRRSIENAIGLIRARYRQPGPAHLVPSKLIFRQKLLHALDPPLDNGARAKLRIC